MTKILKGPEAINYSAGLLETIGQADEQNQVTFELGVIGALLGLQFEQIAHLDATNPDQVSLPISPSGFPDVATVIADARQALARRRSAEKLPDQIARQVIADFINLKSEKLSAAAKKRTESITREDVPSPPWKPNPRDRVADAAEKIIDRAARSGPTVDQASTSRHRFGSSLFSKRQPPAPAEDTPGLQIEDDGQKVTCKLPDRPCPYSHKFIPIPLNKSSFPQSLILRFKEDSSGSPVLTEVFPDPAKRIQPPRSNQSRQKRNIQPGSPAADSQITKLNGIGQSWGNSAQVAELLVAIDFTAHPDHNPALLQALIVLATTGKEAINQLRRQKQDQIKSSPPDHIDLQIVLAKTASLINSLPEDYTALIQAMLRDSLEPRRTWTEFSKVKPLSPTRPI